MAQPLQGSMTVAEFLQWDSRQDRRHEFDNGVVIAMAGGTQAHDLIRGEVYRQLSNQLRRCKCRAHMDVRLVCPSGAVRYPEVSIVCAPIEAKATELSDVTVAIEVLSQSTQSTDYILKTRDYGSVSSITLCLIFIQTDAHVDIIARDKAGDWDVREAVDGADGVIELADIGVRLTLAEIYDGLV